MCIVNEHVAQQLADPSVVHVGSAANPAFNNVGLDCSGNFVVSNSDSLVAHILPAGTQGLHGSGTDLDALVSCQIGVVQVLGLLGGTHADEAFQAEAHPLNALSSSDLCHQVADVGIGSKQDLSLLIAQCVVRQVSDAQTSVDSVGNSDLSGVDGAHHQLFIDGLIAAQLAAGEILHGNATLGLLSDQCAQVVVQAGSNVLSGSVGCQTQFQGVLCGVISSAAGGTGAGAGATTATSQQGQCHDACHDQGDQTILLHFNNPPYFCLVLGFI